MKSQLKNTPVIQNAQSGQVFPPTNGALQKVNGKVPHDQIELPDSKPGENGYIIRAKRLAPLLANACHMLREKWPGVLAFDEFAQNVTLVKSPNYFGEPWAGSKPGEMWTDLDAQLTTIWFQRWHLFIHDSSAAVWTVAHDRVVHPVRDYLNGLVWDGTRRLDSWLFVYLGAEYNKYTEAVGRCWLISAVARIFQPGAKADHCLVLEGEQGTLKSTLLEKAATPWFTDKLSEFGSKDSEQELPGVWIIELSEMDSLSKVRVSRIKAFMSRRIDRYRGTWKEFVKQQPRQCVFAGTINRHHDYLDDETGARRFWPVRCGTIDIPLFMADRDQIWAEAVARYRDGTAWWLDKETEQLARDEQARRLEHDPWHDIVTNWVQKRNRAVTVDEILRDVIGKEPKTWMRGDRDRICYILRGLSFKQSRPGAHSEERQRVWSMDEKE